MTVDDWWRNEMEQCHREDGGVCFQDRALHSGLVSWSPLGWELRQMSRVGTVALGKGEESTTLWAGMEEEGHWGDVLSAYLLLLLLHSGSDADAIPVEWTQPEVGVSCVREGVRPRWPCSNTRSPSRHATLAGLGFGKAYSVCGENLSAVCRAWKSGLTTFRNTRRSW